MTREEKIDEMSLNMSVEDLEDTLAIFYQGARNFISRTLCDKGNPYKKEIVLDDNAVGLSCNEIPTVTEISEQECEGVIHIVFRNMEDRPCEVDDLLPGELLEIIKKM